MSKTAQLPFLNVYDCLRASLRSQGGGDRPSGLKVGGTIASHAKDISHFVSSLPSPPVVLAHSISGLMMQWYLLLQGTTNKSASGN